MPLHTNKTFLESTYRSKLSVFYCARLALAFSISASMQKYASGKAWAKTKLPFKVGQLTQAHDRGDALRADGLCVQFTLR
jgi:hypothetical protein